MKENNHDTPGAIDPALIETEATLREAARLDGLSAVVSHGQPNGHTLEDRIFASTRDVLNRPNVAGRIGAGSAWSRPLKIAAAIALFAGIPGVLWSVRNGTGTQPATVAKNDSGVKSAADVELVLAAVSLLDEPLNGNFDQLAEDAARLHELVTSDRSYGTESEEKTVKQGV